MLAYRVVLWANVPSERQAQWANAAFVSAYKDVSAGDLIALQAGQLAERVITVSVDPGTTLAEIRNRILGAQADWQNHVSTYNHWNRYGTVWDDVTGWIAGGVT
jgi:hypothetical protein